MIKAKWGHWSSLITVSRWAEDEVPVALDIDTRVVGSPHTPPYASFARLTVEEAKKLRRELGELIFHLESQKGE